ncbi:hypothetical protein OG264_03710 [Streptomyces xanthophaeus]|uniref:hypothetical protein n=1 Tax=Streptomyces xanthophaeus TaxID=67385 RepID=UPI00386EBB7E|nr:hypothetical protein OG264_03710 [Streptomyces xanthophaeus]WST64335.1 hypothetical protein OG605_34650 [Streptomyces xanthophaeus]
MRTHRYKKQTAGFGVFLGISAVVSRPPTTPAVGAPVSDRVWLAASAVDHAFYGNRLALDAHELGRLRHGLATTAADIERVETCPFVLVEVRALEIVEAHYQPTALAAAIAGWAAEEFGLPPRPWAGGA